MRALLVRHGQATSNTNTETGIVGQHAELTPEGEQQIQATAKYLGEMSIAEEVFASPVHRAKQSAEVIANVMGVSVIIDERLREIEKGDWTGRPVSLVAQLEGEVPHEERHSFRPPGERGKPGENWEDVAARMKNFLDEMCQSGREEIVIVSHNHPIRMVIGALIGKPIETWENMALDNASITALIYQNDGTWQLDETLCNMKPYSN